MMSYNHVPTKKRYPDKRHVTGAVLLACVLLQIFCTSLEGVPIESEGTASHGLLPSVIIWDQHAPRDYEIEVFFRPTTTNFAELRYRWLKVPGALGAKCLLTDSQGRVIPIAKSPSGTHLPPLAVKVADLVGAIRPRSKQGYAWMSFSSMRPCSAETLWLKSAFNVDPADAYALRVVPMLYKRRGDGDQADLVRFPPIVLNLPGLDHRASAASAESGPRQGRAPPGLPVAWTWKHQDAVAWIAQLPTVWAGFAWMALGLGSAALVWAVVLLRRRQRSMGRRR